jgi:hypothetical protein
MPHSQAAVMARARSGYIQQLPSGTFRVSVHAGTDPAAAPHGQLAARDGPVGYGG